MKYSIYHSGSIDVVFYSGTVFKSLDDFTLSLRAVHHYSDTAIEVIARTLPKIDQQTALQYLQEMRTTSNHVLVDKLIAMVEDKPLPTTKKTKSTKSRATTVQKDTPVVVVVSTQDAKIATTSATRTKSTGVKITKVPRRTKTVKTTTTKTTTRKKTSTSA